MTQPDLHSDLAPLDRLDLLAPDNEALALWIFDRLHSGNLIAYGRPIGGGRFRPSAVPTTAWPDLALAWSSGQAKHKVATPVNWKQGEEVIIAGSVTNEDAKKTYPDGWKEPKPYIRIVPHPGA